MLGNGDVRISYVVAGAPSPLYRNGIGDECLFVERGTARVETIFGAFDVGPGDYVIIPRATTHRWVPSGEGEPLRVYCIEANSHIAPPKRYLSRFGQLLEHSPYCERDLRLPAGPMLAESRRPGPVGGHRGAHQAPRQRSERRRRHRLHLSVPPVRRRRAGTAACTRSSSTSPTSSRSPGGCTSHRRCTRSSRAYNFVVCNFVPRKVDYHPLSIPVPYYHSNVDSDEIMFYVDGDYEARKGSGIGKGSISVHPGGHAHGPQTGAYEKSIGVHYFDELAVMVDTFRPLELGEAGLASDDGAYAWSWAKGVAGAKEPPSHG